MADQKKHKWTFPARFRTGAYGWKASRLACQRLREAVSEIRKVARKDPAIGAGGAVRLLEKLWPALEYIDSSSGSLGSAVNAVLEALIPIIINAQVDRKTRDQWLERLWQAMQEDGVEYLGPVGDQWGELCASVEVAGRWADELIPILRACWTDSRPGSYFRGSTACLSCLIEAGRHEEVLELLALDTVSFWHYRRYGVRALLESGKKAEALKFAEASRGLNEPDAAIDRVCEEILVSSGLHEEAYRRYGLSAARGNTWLARFRSVAKRYPTKDEREILTDLIATTPGQEGKWFATAKELKLYGLAVKLALQSPCDPKTLTRAARDHLDSEPAFSHRCAVQALHWFCQGWGYEVTSTDVRDAYDLAVAAAVKMNSRETLDQLQGLIESQPYMTNPFMRESLSGRRRSQEISLTK